MKGSSKKLSIVAKGTLQPLKKFKRVKGQIEFKKIFKRPKGHFAALKKIRRVSKLVETLKKSFSETQKTLCSPYTM